MKNRTLGLHSSRYGNCFLILGDSSKPAEKVKKAEKTEKKAAIYESNTKPGDMKDVQCPLPDAYSPAYVEAAWYSWWEKEGKNL